MAEIIVIADLPTAIQSVDSVALMVAGANAKASRVAPCLTWTGTPDTEPEPSEDQLAEARLILAGAVKRWAESSAGALQSKTIGPYGEVYDTRQRTGYNLWPSEIEQLQAICSGGKSTSAFSITPSRSSGAHMPWCSYILGANYCSCGADLTNYEYPLYEGGILTGTDGYDDGY